MISAVMSVGQRELASGRSPETPCLVNRIAACWRETELRRLRHGFGRSSLGKGTPNRTDVSVLRRRQSAAVSLGI
jgi:hypothetical protein